MWGRISGRCRMQGLVYTTHTGAPVCERGWGRVGVRTPLTYAKGRYFYLYWLEYPDSRALSRDTRHINGLAIDTSQRFAWSVPQSMYQTLGWAIVWPWLSVITAANTLAITTAPTTNPLPYYGASPSPLHALTIHLIHHAPPTTMLQSPSTTDTLLSPPSFISFYLLSSLSRATPSLRSVRC